MTLDKLKNARLPLPYVPEDLTIEERPYFQKFCEVAMMSSKLSWPIDPFKLANQSGIDLVKVNKDSSLGTYIWVAFLSINMEVIQ